MNDCTSESTVKSSVSRNSLTSLSRLVASENSASDLLALLIELDDQPVGAAFELPQAESFAATRELATGVGRIDIVIYGDGGHSPIAVVEMKGASSIHGDQLVRYEEWAASLGVRPKLFLCAFDGDEDSASESWNRVRLRDIYAAWADSPHPHARWLSNEIVTLLDEWDAEADGVLGRRTGYYVPDIATKRMARDIDCRLDGEQQITEATALRDNGGSPMILAWSAHPRDPEDFSVAVGVDLRSPVRRSGSTSWKLRPMVEVDLVEGSRDLAEARGLAFHIARSLNEKMSGTAVRSMLHERGFTEFADFLSVGRHDGFRRSRDGFDFDEWKKRIATSSHYPGGGVFGSDRGLRLSTILDLETSELNRREIAAGVVAIVRYLYEEAGAT